MGDSYNSQNQNFSLETIEATYDLTISKLRGQGIQPVICTIIPSEKPAFNALNVKLNAFLRAKAAQGLVVADIALPVLYQADGTSNPVLYETDGIHLLPSSYALLTDTVAKAIATAKAKL